jgi:hypothetical protein
MPTLHSTFQGLNTDVDMNRLPSGTADLAVNVDLAVGALAKRAGFSEWDASVSGGDSAVLGLFQMGFATGDYYVIAKCADGKLYQRNTYPTDAAAFTVVTSVWAHVVDEGGWGYGWADRFHYVDSGGASRWHPTNPLFTKALKDGLPRPVAPTAIPSSPGAKEGMYHFHYAFRNSKTLEEGAVSTPSGLVECHIDNDQGAAAVIMSVLPRLAYECDQHVIYSTMGHTEYIDDAETPAECFSFVAYEEVVLTYPANPQGGAHKADHVLDHTLRFTNAGGEPPAAPIGCFTGSRAVYAGNTGVTGSQPELIRYSIPGMPTMVPQNQHYLRTTIQGAEDSRTVYPKPYLAEIKVPSGTIVAMAYGGGVVGAFSETEAFRILTQNDGQMYMASAKVAVSVSSAKAAVGSKDGVHCVGYGNWLFMTHENSHDLAKDRFAELLKQTPDPSKTVTGYYSYADQVWAAVVPVGGTLAQRILVWDRTVGRGGAMVAYDLACLGTRAARTTEFAWTYCNLTFTAERPGNKGNDISVIFVSDAVAGSESVTVNGFTVTVHLLASTTTGNAVVTAWQKNPDAMALASVKVKTGDPGTLPVPAASRFYLVMGDDDEGITCMCEMVTPKAVPVMLLGTTKGRILKYPSGTTDDGEAFAARYRGYWGQERVMFNQRIGAIQLHGNAGVTNNVTLATRCLLTSTSATAVRYAQRLVLNDGWQTLKATFDRLDGRIFQIDLCSDQSAGAWSIRDMICTLKNMDAK